jgi:hypothetical protein
MLLGFKRTTVKDKQNLNSKLFSLELKHLEERQIFQNILRRTISGRSTLFLTNITQTNVEPH